MGLNSTLGIYVCTKFYVLFCDSRVLSVSYVIYSVRDFPLRTISDIFHMIPPASGLFGIFPILLFVYCSLFEWSQVAGLEFLVYLSVVNEKENLLFYLKSGRILWKITLFDCRENWCIRKQ